MIRPGEAIIGMAVAVAIMIVAGAFIFIRNRDEAPDPTQSETIAQRFDSDGTPHITIESWRGQVTVRGSNSSEVRVEIRRTGTGADEQEAFDNLTRLEARAFQEGDTVTVRTFRTNDAPARAGTRAVIVVVAPAGASVQVVAAGGEPVIVSDITGDIEIEAEGPIEFEAAPGAPFELDAVTVSGSIDDGIGLDGAPVADGSGQSLEASRGDGGAEVVLRAGSGITMSR